jgi:hypothetical protein
MNQPIAQPIRAGAMLLQDGAFLPKTLVIATASYVKNWSAITQFTSTQLRRAVEREGWTFFFMAGEIHARAFGFDEQSRTDRAMLEIIDRMKRDHCNCLEITELRQGSWLRLPFTTIIAHARHIQQSYRFDKLGKAAIRPHSYEWLQEQNQNAAAPAYTGVRQ